MEASQIEALGRLSDPEFLREVKLVCSLLPVQEILGQVDGVLSEIDRYAGGARAASPSSTTRHLKLPDNPGLSAPNTAHSGNRKHRSLESTLKFLDSSFQQPGVNLTVLNSIMHVNNDKPTMFENKYHPGLPGTAPGDTRSQMMNSLISGTASIHSAGTHGTAGNIRVHTTSAEAYLPHMNMEMGSPIVMSRGTSISMKKSNVGGDISVQPESHLVSGIISSGRGGTEPFESSLLTERAISTDERLGQGAPAEVTAGVNSGAGSVISGLGPTKPIRSSSPLSFNNSRKRTPKTEGNKSYSASIDNLLNPRGAGANKFGPGGSVGTSSMGGSVTMGRAPPPPLPMKHQSVRLGHAIDSLYERSSANVVVMCRRDAQRAAGEEVLSRSTVEDLRSKALKRSQEMVELRNTRSMEKTAQSFGLDY